MRQTFHHADFEDLVTLWNEFYPEKYRIDSELLRLNTVQSPVFDWGASLISLEGGKPTGFVIFKKSASPSLYTGLDRETAHLGAVTFTSPNAGLDLLAEAKQTLRSRGISRIVFGTDSRHFFPGCPQDFSKLCDFLMVQGFESGDLSHDLESDLKSFQPVGGLPKGFTARPMLVEDEPIVRKFLVREFPGRWAFDVLSKVRLEEDYSQVFLLLKDGEVEGFALLQWFKHHSPIGGGVWRQDLGPKWGSLGPIGISQSLRGQGAGLGLLSLALQQLKAQGVERAIIDWTTLVDFYEKVGFSVTRSYRSMSLDLD